MRSNILGFLGLTLTLALCACGGGGSGATAPPTGLSYPAPPVFTVSQPISALIPTVTGSVAGYAVSPALPAGLLLNPSTGAISGAPSAPSARASYTITASNAGGAATTSLSIAVNDVPPVVSYGSTSFTLEPNEAMTPIAPTVAGGQIVSWSIVPALPNGVALGNDGTIGGTPTAAGATVSYVVTAQNSGGVATATFSLTIESTLLVDLGHVNAVRSLDYDAARLLSVDERGRWVLWDTQDAENLANGYLSCRPDCGQPNDLAKFAALAGGLLAIRVGDGLELRSAADGRVTGRVSPAPSWWRLATDGSYVAVGSTTELKVLSATGAPLLARSGNYATAIVFAAPTQLRVARGAAGTNVIERIAVPTGAVTTSPFFQGTFHSWFLDGERFLTNVSNTVWVYSRDAIQQDVKVLPTSGALPGLAGRGGWFWTFANYTLDIYEVGASATAAASYPVGTLGQAVPSSATIGLLPADGSEIGVVDLSGNTPTHTVHAAPVSRLGAYAAGPAGDALVGNRDGVVVRLPNGSAPRYFALGTAFDVAGAGGRAFVAVSCALIYYDAAAKSEEGRIEFPGAALDVSDDSALLLAVSPGERGAQCGPPNPQHTVFGVPSEIPVATFPRTPLWLSAVIAGSGQVLGRVFDADYRREVVTFGGTVLWSDDINPPADPNDLTGWFPADIAIRLSPDGTHIAVATRERHTETLTNIYTNGSLTAVVNGWPVGWLDDQRLLVNRYVDPPLGLGQGHVDAPAYANAVIVSATGQLLSTTALPELTELQRVGADGIYSRERNLLFSMPTGTVMWSSSRPILGQGYGAISGNHGAVAGNRVVFVSDATVRAERY